ncbi:hypothetical protein WMY93_008023 [Mugilogobius chulae]|uniref:Protein kinase domain-containing protein n=1 Tax=Mugilogobius chulae TaxID=88201 RepID=A0AAW0PEX9_9GOBI
MSASNDSAEFSLRMDDVISGEFGSYVVKQLKGEGTYARVARCVDLSTRQDVAVKISKLQFSSAAEREARVLQKLSSVSRTKNVVRFVSSFHYLEHHCLVLEHLDQSLYDFICDRSFQPLLVPEIRYIAEQLLAAFEELARLKIAHCDLKPDNVMLVITNWNRSE